MTLSVLEGHSPIASFFKYDILYLWHVARSLCMRRAFLHFSLCLTVPFVSHVLRNAMAHMGVDHRVDKGTCPPHFLKWGGQNVFCPATF